MGWYSRSKTSLYPLRGVTILLSILTLSLSFVGSASALTLDPVRETVTSVTKIIRYDDSTARKARQDSNKAESANSATSRTTTGTQPSLSSQSAPPSAPQSEVALPAEPLPELPTIDTADMTYPATLYAPRPLAAVAASTVVAGVSNDPIAPLQATNHGWKLFSVGWYWWLLGAVTGYGLVRWAIALRRRQNAIGVSV